MRMKKKLTSAFLAVLVVLSALPAVVAAGTAPGYKLINTYDAEKGAITAELYLTGGFGGVGQLGVYYDTELISLAATKDGELTTEYDGLSMSYFAKAASGVSVTAETNNMNSLINEEEGEFFFAWYASGAGTKIDAREEDVKLLTFKFLVNPDVTAGQLEEAGEELIMFATDIPSDSKVLGYNAGAYCSNEEMKSFTNKPGAKYVLSTSVIFEGLDIEQEVDSVTIKVVDKDEKPVKDAYVKVGSEEIKTDANGEAKFTVSGTYSVSYKYLESDTYVSLPDGETTAVLSAPAKMAAPTLTKGTEKLTVKWKVPASGGSDITKYVISLTGGGSTVTRNAEADVTSIEVKNLVGGAQYSVKVKAVNALGEGEYSDTKTATPEKTQSGGGNTGGGGGGAPAVETFTVTYDAGENGKLSGGASEKVASGSTPKSVPSVVANDGYEFAGWAVSGTTIIVNPSETKITKNTTFTAQYKEAAKAWVNPFKDVKESDWYYESVKAASEKGLMNGISAEEFGPDGNVTRAMFVTVLYRMQNQPEVEGGAKFTDIESGSWYEKAVIWASANGIVNGVTETEFSPNANITREQMAAMVYRYAKFNGEGFTGLWAFPLDFADAASINEYAYEALCWCTMKGIINGMGDNTLAPQGNSTRAQSAAVFIRTLDALVK